MLILAAESFDMSVIVTAIIGVVTTFITALLAYRTELTKTKMAREKLKARTEAPTVEIPSYEGGEVSGTYEPTQYSSSALARSAIWIALGLGITSIGLIFILTKNRSIFTPLPPALQIAAQGESIEPGLPSAISQREFRAQFTADHLGVLSVVARGNGIHSIGRPNSGYMTESVRMRITIFLNQDLVGQGESFYSEVGDIDIRVSANTLISLKPGKYDLRVEYRFDSSRMGEFILKDLRVNWLLLSQR